MDKMQLEHRMMFRISPDLYALLEEAAESELRTPAAMVRYIIARHLAERYPDRMRTTTPAQMARAARRQTKQPEK